MEPDLVFCWSQFIMKKDQHDSNSEKSLSGEVCDEFD